MNLFIRLLRRLCVHYRHFYYLVWTHHVVDKAQAFSNSSGNAKQNTETKVICDGVLTIKENVHESAYTNSDDFTKVNDIIINNQLFVFIHSLKHSLFNPVSHRLTSQILINMLMFYVQ